MYTKPMYLDRKLYQDVDVLPIARDNPDMYGVEIELEGRRVKSAKRDIQAYWNMANDGSLRVVAPGAEAIEYVLRGPLKYEATIDALDKMFAHLNAEGVEVFPSYRTSIHIHLNCAAETMRTIYNLMTLAVIFDELFVSQNGEHRIGNNFCLRAKDAQGQLAEIVYSILHHGNPFHVNGNHRYSSVNFMSLFKYGTMEFRSLECTTDVNRVKHWLETLIRLKAAARQFEDPQDIIRYYSRMSAKEFLYFTLGHQAPMYAAVEGFEEMLHSGMRLAQDLAYAAKWIGREDKADDRKKDDAKAKYMQLLQMVDQAQPAIAMPPPGAQQANLGNWILAPAPQAAEEWH